MKRNAVMCLAFVAVLAVCAVAVTAEQLKLKTIQHLDLAVAKQRQLKTKVYSGTWDDILAARVADVNEITSNVYLAKQSARQAIELGEPEGPQRETVQGYVARLIAERGKEQMYGRKQLNGIFLQAVEELVNDPNALPPESDPNYLSEVERLAEFRAVCIEIVTDHMGGL